MPKAPVMDQDDEVIEVALHPALRPALEAWLKGRGLQLLKISERTRDSLSVYVVSPTDETLEVHRATQGIIGYLLDHRDA
jgi:hypothetical protein